MAMDNMSIRKAQLGQLDKFVKQLYDETQMVKKYGVELPDLEMLYLHIHELIEELLQCQTSDEFMDMIQQLHQAIAGVLIVVAPANASQVKKDMEGAYDDFQGENFDDFLQNLQKTAVSKFGNNKPKQQQQPEEEVENDPQDLIKMMDLEDHVKPKKGKAKVEKAEEEETEDIDPDADPFDDVYKSF